MKDLQISDVTKHVNTLANAIFGDVRTKRTAQESMIKLIGLACQRYHNDKLFRVQMDGLMRELNKPKLEDPLKGFAVPSK